MGLLDSFSESNLGKNLLDFSSPQRQQTLLGISQALAAPSNRGDTRMSKIMDSVSKTNVSNKEDSDKRMSQILSAMPKGVSFKNISPESKAMIKDYLRTGDQTLLMNIDFGTGASAGGKVTAGMITSYTPESIQEFRTSDDYNSLVAKETEKQGPLVTVNNMSPTADKELTKKNVARLSELQVSSGTRGLSLTKAQGFLKAFQDGKASSGAGRKLLSFSPFGTYTTQGEFDEQFDSFSEIAARAKLKALGEIRPTDADVKGMKESLFGIGKDEDVNVQLLQDFIQEQTALQTEYAGLTSANEAGTISEFQSIAGTMSPREADPIKITGWFNGIDPDSELFDDIVGKMTGAQREILFQEIQAGRF